MLVNVGNFVHKNYFPENLQMIYGDCLESRKKCSNGAMNFKRYFGYCQNSTVMKHRYNSYIKYVHDGISDHVPKYIRKMKENLDHLNKNQFIVRPDFCGTSGPICISNESLVQNDQIDIFYATGNYFTDICHASLNTKDSPKFQKVFTPASGSTGEISQIESMNAPSNLLIKSNSFLSVLQESEESKFEVAMQHQLEHIFKFDVSPFCDSEILAIFPSSIKKFDLEHIDHNLFEYDVQSEHGFINAKFVSFYSLACSSNKTFSLVDTRTSKQSMQIERDNKIFSIHCDIETMQCSIIDKKNAYVYDLRYSMKPLGQCDLNMFGYANLSDCSFNGTAHKMDMIIVGSSETGELRHIKCCSEGLKISELESLHGVQKYDEINHSCLAGLKIIPNSSSNYGFIQLDSNGYLYMWDPEKHFNNHKASSTNDMSLDESDIEKPIDALGTMDVLLPPDLLQELRNLSLETNIEANCPLCSGSCEHTSRYFQCPNCQMSYDEAIRFMSDMEQGDLINFTNSNEALSINPNDFLSEWNMDEYQDPASLLAKRILDGEFEKLDDLNDLYTKNFVERTSLKFLHAIKLISKSTEIGEAENYANQLKQLASKLKPTMREVEKAFTDAEANNSDLEKEQSAAVDREVSELLADFDEVLNKLK